MNREKIPTPPYSIEAEQSVIGAILIDKDAIYKITDIVHPEDFFRDEHAFIIEAAYKLAEQQKPIDIISVKNKLDELGKDIKNIGGLTYLARVADAVPDPANVVHYAKIVRDKSKMRKLMQAGDKLFELASRENKASIVEVAANIMQIIEDGEEKNTPFTTVIEKVGEEALYPENNKVVYKTGYKSLDKYIRLTEGSLNIIAARPGTGKTTLAVNIMMNMVRKKIPVLFISLEMSQEEIAKRILSSHAKVKHRKIGTSMLSEEEMRNIVESVGELSKENNIQIIDKVPPEIDDILLTVRKEKVERDIKVVVIDYLQLLHASKHGKTRVEEITYITSMLKSIARITHTVFIVLSQLNRSVESRENNEPRLSDLRDSGSIEQDADSVVFLYFEDEDANKNGIVTIKIAKNRNGEVGKEKIIFIRDYLLFADPYNHKEV